MEVQFLTINEFKTKVGATSMKILKNPKTSKLFLAGDNGQNYKVQQAIDGSKEMKILVPESGDIADACLTNVKAGAVEIFSI
jgi:hypothetical protein